MARQARTVNSPTLHSERVVLRGLTAAATERLAEIQSLPEVERWWGPADATDFEKKIADDDLAAWVVEVDGSIAGFIQAYEETDPQLRHAGMDLFLDPSVHRRGLGQDVSFERSRDTC